MLASSYDGVVSAYPILQPDKNRLVVHLVNYDIDYENDNIREKSDLALNIPRPDYLSGDIRCEIYTPSMGGAQSLEVSASGNTLSCTVPTLGIHAAVVFATE